MGFFSNIANKVKNVTKGVKRGFTNVVKGVKKTATNIVKGVKRGAKFLVDIKWSDFKKPEVWLYVKFSFYVTFSINATVIRNMGDPIKHQHRGHRQLCITWPKQLSFSTLDQLFIIKAKFSIRGHVKIILVQNGTINSHPRLISNISSMGLYYLLYDITPIIYDK